MPERVLFFSPHAGIWQHGFPEALVANAVSRGGADVVQITCDRQFASYCVVMTSRGMREDAAPAAKAKVCAQCERDRDFIRRDFAHPSCDLGSVLEPADERRISGKSSLSHVPAPRHEVTLAKETALIRAQLARLVGALYGGVPGSAAPVTLRHYLTTA
jgi:hypothetical protein